MTLDFSDAIKKLRDIQQAFNHSEKATDKYALLEALNHLAENEIKFKDKYWLGEWRKAMLREKGMNV